MISNREIVDMHLSTILRCVDCQFAKLGDKQFKGDFTNDLIITLLEYSPEKMNDAHANNHFNALVTAICVRNLWSHTSPYYKQYKKFMDKSDDITEEIEDTVADE